MVDVVNQGRVDEPRTVIGECAVRPVVRDPREPREPRGIRTAKWTYRFVDASTVRCARLGIRPQCWGLAVIGASRARLKISRGCLVRVVALRWPCGCSVRIIMKDAIWISTLSVAFGLTACVAAAVEEITADDAPLQGAAATTITWPVVAIGAAGDLVVAGQHLLTARGHAVSADGDFGSATQAAVSRFQRTIGLTADGTIGGATWEALITDVKQGSTGPAVQAAQRLLVTRIGAQISIDGTVGTATLNAITSFQRIKCLAQTGVVGRFTWNSLVTGRTYCTTPPPPPAGQDFCQFSWEERPGHADYTTINWYERSIGRERARTFDRAQAQTLRAATGSAVGCARTRSCSSRASTRRSRASGRGARRS
ncbi:MAG: peptidoglycan-binding protein [Kofleriaceae bacterium]